MLDVSDEGDEDSDEDVAVSDTQEGKSASEVVVGAGKSANSKSSPLGGGNLISVI
jgi:hypothetical protein